MEAASEVVRSVFGSTTAIQGRTADCCNSKAKLTIKAEGSPPIYVFSGFQKHLSPDNQARREATLAKIRQNLVDLHEELVGEEGEE